MHLNFALKGAGFFMALVILIFFLKIICPLQTGCLADPFLLVIFSPLALIEFLNLSAYMNLISEPFMILAFWGIVGFVFSFLLYIFYPNKQEDKSFSENI